MYIIVIGALFLIHPSNIIQIDINIIHILYIFYLESIRLLYKFSHRLCGLKNAFFFLNQALNYCSVVFSIWNKMKLIFLFQSVKHDCKESLKFSKICIFYQFWVKLVQFNIGEKQLSEYKETNWSKTSPAAGTRLMYFGALDISLFNKTLPIL